MLVGSRSERDSVQLLDGVHTKADSQSSRAGEVMSSGGQTTGHSERAADFAEQARVARGVEKALNETSIAVNAGAFALGLMPGGKTAGAVLGAAATAVQTASAAAAREAERLEQEAEKERQAAEAERQAAEKKEQEQRQQEQQRKDQEEQRKKESQLRKASSRADRGGREPREWTAHDIDRAEKFSRTC